GRRRFRGSAVEAADLDWRSALRRAVARLGDEHRPRPILERRPRRLAVEHEPGEGAQHLAHRRDRLREGQRRALEAVYRIGEAELMVADELPLVAGEVDEPRAAPRRAA